MRVLVATFCCLAVGACDQLRQTGADDRICMMVPPLDIAAMPEPILASEQCVHRWAYRLAGSPDPAPVVADAVLSACSDIILRYAVTLEGDSDRNYEMVKNWRREKALFHVVQARAGRCTIPG